MPQTLVQKFGVAAVRGVARNKSIAEFQLQPCKSVPQTIIFIQLDLEMRYQQVVDGILALLTPDERRKFRVRKDQYGCPSIELCALGEWCTVSIL